MLSETNTRTSEVPDNENANRWRFRTLPQVVQLCSFAALGMVLLSIFQWLLQDPSEQSRYLHHYGQMVASQLTRLSEDAVVREDAIALNVLAERVASDPAISSVSVYSLDGRTLANYGSQDTAERNSNNEFRRPIQIADATAGFVRVTVNPDALNSTRNGKLPIAQLRTAAGALFSVLAAWTIATWITRPDRLARETREAREAREVLKTGAQARDIYLFVMRLFNSDDMGPRRRDASIASSLTRIAGVAESYEAEVKEMEAGVIAVAFKSSQEEDRAFQIACAALAMVGLCNQPGGGRYRYSLQHVHLEGELVESQLARSRGCKIRSQMLDCSRRWLMTTPSR